MKLVELTTIKTNFENADFWLVRRGSIESVGTPVKSFSQYHIGIKVVRTDILLPNYLYYAMKHVHTTGYWKPLANGTLKLVHITTTDVKNITIG
tara:strand:+ start:308 stop:589 length:282 start_codon:yes stop_codon:yes gene_type:complete